jgi:hypothetical protein
VSSARGIAFACAIALAAGCAASGGGNELGASEDDATALDRMLIGKAAQYPADTTLRARIDELDGSMAARRKMAWEIVAKVLAPVTIAAPADDAPKTMPRFQTWYSREDFLPMFDRLFRALPDDDKKTHARFGDKEIAEVFPWEATMATSLASFTKDRYLERLHELETPGGLHSLGGNGRALMSPSYVAHLLRSYPELVSCKPPAANDPPPNAENFAPCLDGELPIDAAAVKARWMPGGAPMPTYDTSPKALADKLARGDFGDGDATADPSDADIYTMQLSADTTMRLAALHIITKELRDWSWITLWWSPEPNTDFGADRPPAIAALGGPWASYKMCVVTGYAEKDPAQPGGPSTWCSNPYLEVGANNAQTNCIGCHQHGGTGETTQSILGAPDAFPDHARTKLRTNFPADYAYTTSAGLDLASSMKDVITALTPP